MSTQLQLTGHLLFHSLDCLIQFFSRAEVDRAIELLLKHDFISAKEIPKFFFVAQRKRRLLLRMLDRFNQEGDEHLALFEQNIIKIVREEALRSML